MVNSRNHGTHWSASARRNWLGIAVSAIAAIIAGLLIFSVGSFRLPAAFLDDDTASLDLLEDALANEVRTREDLTARISELESDLSRLRLMVDQVANSSLARDEVPPGNSAAVKDGGDATQPDLAVDVDATGFDTELLLSQGIDEDAVAHLYDTWTDHQMDRASILNNALREGWFLEERHSAELAQLNQDLREEIGEEGYDRYLYALGKPNRLRAAKVFEGSPASEAGLMGGDLILRYDDVRLFKTGELVMAASRGELGAPVAMEILRNDRRLTITVRRGPLGVMLKPGRGAPIPE
jgi:hypothetical protein